MEKDNSAETDNNIIWIHNNSDYEYPNFDKWYKDVWLDEFDYDKDGVYKGDRYVESKRRCDDYLALWSELHNVALDSKEVAAERELVLEQFLKKYKIDDITPEEVEKAWEEFSNSESMSSERSFYETMNWDDNLRHNLCCSNHFLHGSNFIATASLGLWDGRRYAARVWHNGEDACLGQLCQSFVDKFMSGLDYISIYADLSDGAIVFDGSHHDGSNSYRLYAVDDSLVTDADGEMIDLEDYMEGKDMEDVIKNVTKPLATIVAASRGLENIKLDPFFNPNPHSNNDRS